MPQPGPSTPVLKSNANYGDRTTLNRLAIQGSGLSQDNADYVPRQRTPVGRPQGPATQPAYPGAPPGIPQEHIRLMEDFARAAYVSQMMAAAASDPTSGPWLRQYAKLAQRKAVEAGQALRAKTPFFE